jgi:hypothetical protein
LEDDVVGMTTEETSIVKNHQSPRSIIYVIAGVVVIAIFFLALGFIRGIDLRIAAVFALGPATGIIHPCLQYLRQPIGVEISANGIQLTFRKGESESILWKDVIAVRRIPLDLGYRRLEYYRKDGRMNVWALSKEPAEKVKEMWSKLFPEGRDISEDIRTKSPTG